MHSSRPRPGPIGERGFTLGEVLTTLGVLGVSLSLAVPSLDSITRSNRRATAINELVATLHVARSEALTRNVPIAVCPSQDGRTCARVAWETGWIRFVDSNGDYEADTGEAVLGATPALTGLRIRTEVFAKAFAYTPSGRAGAPDGAQGTGDFTFCANDSRGDAQVVLISALGQPVLANRRADGQEADCSVS